MMDHAKALDADDPELLDDISCRFEALGFVLYAAEAAATASLAYGPRRRALALAAERRAGVLASQCEGAITPALRRSPRNPLSVREEEIAALAAAGMTDKDIAGNLHLSVRTVHAHLRNIYSKLGVANRRELCRHSTF
jgi:DNA-binding NarL/FixJ family response regulator